MALYAASFSVAGVNTANSTLVNLKTAATDRARVREVGLFLSVLPTTAPDLVLVRMNAVGTGAITTGTTVPQDPADAAAATTIETAWATARPTVTGGHFRRALLPLTIGAGIVWTMPPGNEIIMAVSTGLCIHNINASGATVGTLNGYVVWDE